MKSAWIEKAVLEQLRADVARLAGENDVLREMAKTTARRIAELESTALAVSTANAGLTATLAIIESQLADARDGLKIAHTDVKAERTAKDKGMMAVWDRVAQSHGSKPISEPPPKPKEPPVQLPLTEAEELERDMWRDSLREHKGMNLQQADELYHHYRETGERPTFTDEESQVIG